MKRKKIIYTLLTIIGTTVLTGCSLIDFNGTVEAPKGATTSSVDNGDNTSNNSSQNDNSSSSSNSNGHSSGIGTSSSSSSSSTGTNNPSQSDNSSNSSHGSGTGVNNPSDNLIELAEKLERSTICVKISDENSSGWGSGVIYHYTDNQNGTYTYRVLTNEHVVDGETNFSIYDGQTSTRAKLVGSSSTYDVAMLSFTTTTVYEPINFASDDVVKGQTIAAMGTPLDMTYYNTFTTGIVSNVTDNKIVHTAFINSGNSGGPLVDLNGNLVGLNNSKLSGQTSSGAMIDGMFMAVPLKQVKLAIDEILSNANENDLKPVCTLGITVQNISTIKYVNSFEDVNAFNKANNASWTQDDFEEYTQKTKYIPHDLNSGLFVSGVSFNSVASKGGIQINDIIVSYNGINIDDDENTLSSLLDSTSYGSTVNIGLYRNSTYYTVQVEFK